MNVLDVARLLIGDMIRPLVSYVAKLLPAPRVIFDREGGSEYLSRWYLRRRPTMPDGSEPFTSTGQLRGDAIVGEGVSIHLHKFHRGDDDHALHNHPWEWAVSLILVGGYVEERRDETKRGRVSLLKRLPGSVSLITKDTFHRVELLEEDAWTIFITGPKFASWGFWERETGEYLPWRAYIMQRRNEEWKPHNFHYAGFPRAGERVRHKRAGWVAEVAATECLVCGKDYNECDHTTGCHVVVKRGEKLQGWIDPAALIVEAAS